MNKLNKKKLILEIKKWKNFKKELFISQNEHNYNILK